MAKLVTLEETRLRLNVVSTEDNDTTLEFLIEDASALVINYLGARAESVLELDTSGVFVEGSAVPHAVRAATVMLVGYLFENRDGDEHGAFTAGYLPAPVVSMLYPLRDPALA
jgi:hypothetical protein